jgi:uncharacterized protein
MTIDLSFLEIGSSNATLTGAFLGRLLGWTFHPLGAEGEGWFQSPTMKVGLHGNDPSPGFLVFFGVPDLDAAIRDVVKLGGSAEAPTEEPGFGRFCMCVDPSGLKFGLHHQPQGQ